MSTRAIIDCRKSNGQNHVFKIGSDGYPSNWLKYLRKVLNSTKTETQILNDLKQSADADARNYKIRYRNRNYGWWWLDYSYEIDFQKRKVRCYHITAEGTRYSRDYADELKD